MEYKKVYTPTELAELLDWFTQNREKMPQELKISKSTATSDLPNTVDSFLFLIEQNSTNPTFGAQIKILFEIKEKLIEQGFC
ncbi:MAG: hypothetical protein RRY07_04010 [Bacteroidaceae bacterium]